MKEYLTVTALNKYLKYRFDNDEHLNEVYLKGEITNFKRHSKGHLYFTIKDENSQIQAIMFKTDAIKFDLKINDGMNVFVIGKVSLYESAGTYQIYVKHIEVSGIGNLYIKYEQLKSKLEQNGYFQEKYKKQIPIFPKKIGVITSKTGAVIRDIYNTINRRYPYLEIIVYPCLVQGENAKYEIKNKIEEANNDLICDCLILARGGGSFEDLFCFNEEIVVNAIFNSKIPIISAIGHETDYTLSDFVSDKRAATPTAAAEIVTPDIINLKKEFYNYNILLTNNFKTIFLKRKNDLIKLNDSLKLLNPLNQLNNFKEQYKLLNNSLNKNIIEIFNNKKRSFLFTYDKFIKMHNLEKINFYKEKLLNLNNQLNLRNPLNVLNRGYALVSKNEKIITSINELNVDDLINIKIKDGNIKAKVIRKE